jgi:hypothetical protein
MTFSPIAFGFGRRLWCGAFHRKEYRRRAETGKRTRASDWRLPRPALAVFLGDFDDKGGREQGSKGLLDQLGAALEREG